MQIGAEALLGAPAAEERSPWWRTSIGYSLYLRSFADSDGDGVGDIAGIVGHLDHLAALGVDLIWVSPFYPSPLADCGYDVVDHTAIDPSLGDLDTFDLLVAEAHRRTMRLVIDLVPNHTSVEHPWFRSAVAEPNGPHRNYYLWADPPPDGGPPNNWVSYFGGSAWERHPGDAQYYLHLFLPEQPDLDWRNPAVCDEFDRILRFWLDRGVDGFRIDVAQGLVKDRRLRSNPVRTALQPGMDRGEQWEAFEHVHDVAQPETLAIFQRWKAICAEYDAVLIGETSVPSAEGFADLLAGSGLDAGFWLPPARLGWEPTELRDAVVGPLLRATDQRAIVWVTSTLDEPRPATRFGGGDLGRRRALALSTVLFFLPGIPFLYQGEELGLVDGVVPPERRVDPVGAEATDSRDGCRTPMPWHPGLSFGFSSSAHTWLPEGGRTAADTACSQHGRSGSWFERYRALIELRRSTPALTEPGVESLDLGTDELLAFRGGPLVVVANLGTRSLPTGVEGDVLFNTHDDLDSTDDGLVLREAQAVVVRTAT